MFFVFFNDTATTEIYTLSLHDALPIFSARGQPRNRRPLGRRCGLERLGGDQRHRPAVRARSGSQLRVALLRGSGRRSEEHTSELQSRQYLVCRLLLEKKKKQATFTRI